MKILGLIAAGFSILQISHCATNILRHGDMIDGKDLPIDSFIDVRHLMAKRQLGKQDQGVSIRSGSIDASGRTSRGFSWNGGSSLSDNNANRANFDGSPFAPNNRPTDPFWYGDSFIPDNNSNTPNSAWNLLRPNDYFNRPNSAGTSFIPNNNFNSPNNNFNNPNLNSSPFTTNGNQNGIIWNGDSLIPDNQNSNTNFNMPATTTQNPWTTTTVVIPGMGTTRSPCEDRCQATTQYDPVCGDNNETYTNKNWLICAQKCGIRVNLKIPGACPLVINKPLP